MHLCEILKFIISYITFFEITNVSQFVEEHKRSIITCYIFKPISIKNQEIFYLNFFITKKYQIRYSRDGSSDLRVWLVAWNIQEVYQSFTSFCSLNMSFVFMKFKWIFRNQLHLCIIAKKSKFMILKFHVDVM